MEFSEKTVERKVVFDGRVFTACLDKSELCDGRIVGREVVLHNGGAGILPVDKDGNVTLVRQYRYGAGKELLEICAGKKEKGEAGIDCALRELSEELGFVAGEVTSLGCLYATPAYCSEVIEIFLARNLESVGASLDDGEFLESVTIPLDKAVSLVMSGEITDSKTQIAILKAERIINGKD